MMSVKLGILTAAAAAAAAAAARSTTYNLTLSQHKRDY
jgi:hypothetical protein